VDLSKLLVDYYEVTSVKEKTLTGNQDWEVYQSRRLDWTGQGQGTGTSQSQSARPDTVVTLTPMEIRTFELTVTLAMNM
jgi:hypothetical protein